MMPSLFDTSMTDVHRPHGSGPAYNVDTMLNELSRQFVGNQFVGNPRRYSRTLNGQPRAAGAMRIAKPGSANNSPRSSTIQSRRTTLIGDGFRGGLQTRSPAMGDMYFPIQASESQHETFYERREPTTSRPARPVSWHPSSQNAQQALFSSQHDNRSSMLYPYPAYNEAEFLASLQQLPPTPAAAYSGYTSPADSFSPLSLPYSNFSSQQMCSPPSQAMPTPQQQQQRQTSLFPPATYTSTYAADLPSELSYLPPSGMADDSALGWEPYAANTAALLNRPTAPPTPEDFACTLGPSQIMLDAPQQQQQQQQLLTQQPQSQPTPPQQLLPTKTECYHQPLIHDDEDGTDPEGGEILYGMGLYDDKDPAGGAATLHQSVVLSLLGGAPMEAPDADKGLGLKLEDAWEPPASDDEEEEDEEEGEEDGEGQEEEEEEE
ncbi:hypothetical protein C8A05DRAFT_12861 [Staphylotrichum tortipilum]|uniref:Uncharacterized protein n=1 Tax=Staphylotrichum tortipilum TaxID=2831512 RepID=A0AAN6MR07_9PEZI|nr:hypothetical protein C8A05DRAFT_12861 [Staphylotrichum longicolle]